MRETIGDLLQKVRDEYQGPQYHFILARLKLRTGLPLSDADASDSDPDRVGKLRQAISEICARIQL